jgi:signal transduction histidine kinase
MYGFASREDMIGKRLLEHMFGGKVSETNIHSNVNLAREGFQAYGFPTEEVTENGEHIYFLNNAVGEIKDDHLVGLWGVQRDITEKKQLEVERERFIVELERKNSELERFTYTVSHDLKAPLVTIRGFLGLLEKDVLSANPERIKTDIERITDSTDKMQTLLNDLLELSRAGRLVNTLEPIPFETVSKDAMKLVAGHIAAKSVRIEIAPNLPVVYGDPNRLIQVMQNLIDNAVKFMGEQKEPQITIGSQVSGTDGTPVLFVRDNGIGIESQEQELVFGLFDKLDSNIDGTGIGLALVKRIIEAHGGKVWVESEGMGKGSTFYFTIPSTHK